MAEPADIGIFGMDERVQVIEPLPQYSAPADQLISSIVLQSPEILLWIDYGVEISAVSDIYGQLTQVRALDSQVFGGQERLDVGQLHRFYLFPLLHIFNQDQSSGGFQTQLSRDLRNDQPFFYSNGHGADCTMPAHG